MGALRLQVQRRAARQPGHLAIRAGKCLSGAWNAGVAELVDALDLGSSAARRGGSSPLARTTINPPSPRRRLATADTRASTGVVQPAQHRGGQAWKVLGDQA